jgi:hypothetical protein
MKEIKRTNLINTTAKELVYNIVDARVEANEPVKFKLSYKHEFSPKHLRAVARKMGLKLSISLKLRSNRMVIVLG